MSFLSLNDDVLLALVSYLSPRDALQLSLTGRAIYPIAIQQVPTAARCEDSEKLGEVHDYMLSDIPNRAHRLKELTIANFKESLGCDYEQYAKLVGDLLEQAMNLKRIVIEGFAELLETDPRIGDAFIALTKLEFVKVFDARTAECFQVIERMRSNPRVLHVGGLETASAYSLLFSSIASFTKPLHLHLTAFGDSESETEYAPMSLPHVRGLTLEESIVPWDALVDTFPNVRCLELCDVGLIHSLDGKCWPKLRHLMLAGDLEYIENLDTLCQVHGLDVLELKVSDVLNAVRVISPVFLSCAVRMTAKRPFWQGLIRAAPRMKALEIDLHRHSSSEKCDRTQWLPRVPLLLDMLPVVYLRINMPCQPFPRNSDDNTFISDEEIKLTLPDIIAKAIPTLRYFVLAVGQKGDPASSESFPLGDSVGQSVFSWWRITGDSSERTLTEIPPWEGERVRQFMLDADLESIVNFDWDGTSIATSSTTDFISVLSSWDPTDYSANRRVSYVHALHLNTNASSNFLFVFDGRESRRDIGLCLDGDNSISYWNQLHIGTTGLESGNRFGTYATSLSQ
ncbi:hypothetical protein A0H81_07425 [Grifola frondosa]|uniref:F-box domain-containing protein n=1 Tax=Grifola frondosa TaxID=5627 RepID=A0A1C7M617_GRIFR|nr:hypothetical protein A0H81_07425 [Grifola frondosa]